MFDLNGKTAVVTGATQGIGFSIANILAAYGAKVFVCGGHDAEKTNAAAAKIPNAVPVTVDLTVAGAIDMLHDATGDADILVINASLQHRAPWDAYTELQFDETITCNLKSAYFLITKYAQGMKTRGWGRIVTIGSVNQYNQHKELSLYAVTKVAQKKMVENFAPELAPFGVTINNIAPGAIRTPRNEEIYADLQRRAAVEAKIPCGRFGKPEDISPAVLLLCSEEGSYITGSEIVIDGGMSL